jgi:hypothetical protein
MENRIGWLDSVGQPSHIHKTTDEGRTTLCGHSPREESLWKITDEIPRKIKGRSNYCLICFEKGKKSLPLIQE